MTSDLLTAFIIFRETKGDTTGRVPFSSSRFVGIISDVNQMGPLAGNWPTSLPVGVGAMFQALDNNPNDDWTPQITVEEADGTATNLGQNYPYSHGAIGKAQNVLTDLENFARMFDVPV